MAVPHAHGDVAARGGTGPAQCAVAPTIHPTGVAYRAGMDVADTEGPVGSRRRSRLAIVVASPTLDPTRVTQAAREPLACAHGTERALWRVGLAIVVPPPAGDLSRYVNRAGMTRADAHRLIFARRRGLQPIKEAPAPARQCPGSRTAQVIPWAALTERYVPGGTSVSPNTLSPQQANFPDCHRAQVCEKTELTAAMASVSGVSVAFGVSVTSEVSGSSSV